MKKGRFTEEQIIGVLKQHEAGRKVTDLARELGVSEATIYTWKSKYGGLEVSGAGGVGVSEATIYTWKSKYGGLEVSEARRLKALEDENRRLKSLVADLSLDK